MTHFRLMTAATAVTALLLATPQARATLMVAGDIGGTAFSCFDNQVGCDTNAAIGSLALANQVINGVAVNGSIQTSTGTPANPGLNKLNTSSLSLINTTASSRTISFVVGDTSFAGPANAFFTSGSGTWETADGSSITLNWFNDPTNGQGAEDVLDTPGLLIDTFSHLASGPADSFSHNGSGPVADPGLFSMTEQAVGILTAGGQLINRGQTEIKTEVPEPASLALLGAALLGVGLVRRRRYNRV